MKTSTFTRIGRNIDNKIQFLHYNKSDFVVTFISGVAVGAFIMNKIKR